jgi:aerobic carbon-monoxide dehydrogenase large subunit
VRDRIIANCGDGQVGIYAGFAMPHLGAMYLVNGNDVAAVDIDLTCVVTNKASLTPVRAFGSYPGRFALDRIMDIAGRRLGIDPLEMRKRNAIKRFPHTTPVGVHVDSGDFIGALDKAAAAVGYQTFRAEQARARDHGRYLGVGFVRSIHAHARIKSIDTSQAARMPGVVAVITGQEFKSWTSVLTDGADSRRGLDGTG